MSDRWEDTHMADLHRRVNIVPIPEKGSWWRLFFKVLIAGSACPALAFVIWYFFFYK